MVCLSSMLLPRLGFHTIYSSDYYRNVYNAQLLNFEICFLLNRITCSEQTPHTFASHLFLHLIQVLCQHIRVMDHFHGAIFQSSFLGGFPLVLHRSISSFCQMALYWPRRAKIHSETKSNDLDRSFVAFYSY